PNCPLVEVPPIWTPRLPAEVWMNLPPTFRLLLAPTLRVPLFVKSPVVARLAPPPRLSVPLLEDRLERPVMLAPAPSMVRLAAWLVMAVPVGTFSVAPLEACHVPAVRLPPEASASDLLSRNRVPDCARMTPPLLRLPLMNRSEVPVPAVLV